MNFNLSKLFKHQTNKAKFSFETGIVLESSRPAAELSYEFWIQKEDDIEQNIRLDKNIPLLEGQRVTMITVAHNNKVYGDYAALINHSAKKYWEVADIGRLFQVLELDSPRFAFGVLGTVAMLLLIFIVIPFFDAVTSSTDTAWNWRIFLGFVLGSSIELALSFTRRFKQPARINQLKKDLRRAADGIIKKYKPNTPAEEVGASQENERTVEVTDEPTDEALETLFRSTSKKEDSLFREPSVSTRHEAASLADTVELRGRSFDEDAGVTRSLKSHDFHAVKHLWNRVKSWRPLKKQ